MKRSAASSSSAVVTPAWILAWSMRRQRAWTAPAAAIRSICSGLFLTITWLQLLFHAQGREHRPYPVVHLVGLGRAVNAAQQPHVLVIGDQRLGLRVVLVEAVADHLGLVVVAGLETGAADVADSLLLGWIELGVEDVPLLGAGPPPAEAADDLLFGHVDQDRGGQLATELLHPRVECLCLAGGPRKPVEDEPVGRLGARDAIGDQSHHHLVRPQ